ncbi:MAG: glycerophosphodiester phosphodiesterase [Nocardioidaceae bacterium]
MNRASRRAVAFRTVPAYLLAGCMVTVLWPEVVYADQGRHDHRLADDSEQPAYERTRLPHVIAHRGASHIAPENTYPSFRGAINNGADRIEMDVQRTKDHRLVIFHDSSLRRTTNVEKVYPKLNTPEVSDLTYKKLRRLDAGGWKAAKWKGTRIPRLSRILRLGKRHHVRMIVELKDPAGYPGVVKQTLRRFRKHDLMRRGYHDPVQLQSFDISAMRRAAHRSSRADIGLLYPNPPVTLKRLRWAQSIDSNHTKVDGRWVHRAQQYGIRVFVWGVNTRPAINRALRMNVDGISTNRPKHTRSIIER